MPNVTPPTDTPFPCPTCGTLDNTTTRRVNEGVATADILCTNGHLFALRWLVAA